MYESKIKFTDYLGKEREETHYFHLNKAELFKWLTTKGDYTLDKLLVRLVKDNNTKDLIEIFDQLICEAYGRISLDGRQFEKSEEILNNFKQTEAYAEFFVDIVSNAEKAAAFLNGILPSDLSDILDKLLDENPEAIPEEVKNYIPQLKAGEASASTDNTTATKV